MATSARFDTHSFSFCSFAIYLFFSTLIPIFSLIFLDLLLFLVVFFLLRNRMCGANEPMQPHENKHAVNLSRLLFFLFWTKKFESGPRWEKVLYMNGVQKFFFVRLSPFLADIVGWCSFHNNPYWAIHFGMNSKTFTPKRCVHQKWLTQLVRFCLAPTFDTLLLLLLLTYHGHYCAIVHLKFIFTAKLFRP